MRKRWPHKLKKLLKTTELNIVEVGFGPWQTSSISKLCCYDINSSDFKSLEEYDMSRQKCSSGPAGNNGVCGMSHTYPFPAACLEEAVALNHDNHECKCCVETCVQVVCGPQLSCKQ